MVSAEATGVSGDVDTASGATVDRLKADVLRLVAPLDRGLAASQADGTEVRAAVERLEASSRPLNMGGGGGGIGGGVSGDLYLLDGTWRLVYSSGFESGSLGGLRPGPPAGQTPLSIGQVTQRIDVAAAELDNIVEIKVAAPWPLPLLEATASLQHSFTVTPPASIRIVFERTTVRPKGALPPFTLPQLPDFLRPPADVRSGEFRTTFVDADVRVSRGDRGEVRVFVRA